jgi:hypothetical protein
MPTVLEVVGLGAPARLAGVDQMPVQGVSMAYSFADGDTPSTRTTQYAVSKAINTAAFTPISASLKECLVEPNANAEDIVPRLQKLFLSLA